LVKKTITKHCQAEDNRKIFMNHLSDRGLFTLP
jgi:hypothetical protein